MDISIEITPRSIDHLHAELQLIQATFPQVNTINIPDILRFETRSWHGCQVAKGYYKQVIPHLRAIDFDLAHPLPIADQLANADIDTVLVVSGDKPRSFKHTVYPNTSIDLIRTLKQQFPHIKVYAAIDPYRYNFQQEYQYTIQKLEAGADGFFTQPFFDCRLMQVYADLLPQTEIYWGVSPVLTAKSKAYWETINRAIFPSHFEHSLQWNRAFALDALDFARQYNHHIYYMPIRVNLADYLRRYPITYGVFYYDIG